jgi:hypothetical protein
MRAMIRPRPTWPLRAMAPLPAISLVLAACGTGAAASPSYVAEFALGADTPEAREFVLTPTPDLRFQVLPAPPMMTVPEPGDEVPLEPFDPPAPAPDSYGESPLERAFQPTVAWVNDGQYLGVVTFGSGSCPDGPTGIEVVADQVIEIRLGPLFSDREVCSADMTGHVTVVELPSQVSPTEPLAARFGDHEVTIEAAGR